mmetsp:Transcript_59929/g.167205  ORF Transcript_59929/g.167205 Transcript_59929/m.167205 type:complete len:375 (-) Transcript_59929:186-1310(-)
MPQTKRSLNLSGRIKNSRNGLRSLLLAVNALAMLTKSNLAKSASASWRSVRKGPSCRTFEISWDSVSSTTFAFLRPFAKSMGLSGCLPSIMAVNAAMQTIRPGWSATLTMAATSFAEGLPPLIICTTVVYGMPSPGCRAKMSSEAKPSASERSSGTKKWTSPESVLQHIRCDLNVSAPNSSSRRWMAQFFIPGFLRSSMRARKARTGSLGSSECFLAITFMSSSRILRQYSRTLAVCTRLLKYGKYAMSTSGRSSELKSKSSWSIRSTSAFVSGLLLRMSRNSFCDTVSAGRPSGTPTATNKANCASIISTELAFKATCSRSLSAAISGNSSKDMSLTISGRRLASMTYPGSAAPAHRRWATQIRSVVRAPPPR